MTSDQERQVQLDRVMDHYAGIQARDGTELLHPWEYIDMLRIVLLQLALTQDDLRDTRRACTLSDSRAAALAQENERLRKAMQPIVDFLDTLDANEFSRAAVGREGDDTAIDQYVGNGEYAILPWRDVYAMRAALTQETTPDG